MKSLSVTLLLLSIQVSAQQADQLFYYLRVSSTNAEVHCYVNGFPAYEITSKDQTTNQLPINMALIGKNNELKIVVKPLGANALVSGGISPYTGGDVVSTDDNKKGPLAFDFKADKEMIKTFSFDNDRFNFSSSLVDTPVLTDKEALKDFGVKILTMVEKSDAKALMNAMMPKVRDAAKAFSVEVSLISESLNQELIDGTFKLPLQKVPRENIIPKPYCNGKVWELTTSDGHPLIYYKDAGSSTSLPIFVAQIDGQLKIVR